MLQVRPRSHSNIRLSIASTCSSSMDSNFPPVKCNLTTFTVTTVINYSSCPLDTLLSKILKTVKNT